MCVTRSLVEESLSSYYNFSSGPSVLVINGVHAKFAFLPSGCVGMMPPPMGMMPPPPPPPNNQPPPPPSGPLPPWQQQAPPPPPTSSMATSAPMPWQQSKLYSYT